MSDFVFYALAVVVMFLSFRFLKSRARTSAAQLIPEKRADAERAGWQFETGQTAVFEIFRWRGVTEGVSWVAEGLRTGRVRNRSNESATRIIRWFAMRPMRVPGPFVLLQVGDEMKALSLKLPDNSGALGKWGERMIAAVLDKGLDVRFGEEIGRQVDARTLTSIADIERHHPGWSALAEPAHHAAMLMMMPALEGVLRDAALTTPLSVVIVPGGLAVSAQAWITNADELRPIVNAGIALVKAVGV